MRKNYTVVFDSGIGGLNVLYELVCALPEENFIYVGDNENTPYGNRHKKDLLNMALKALAPTFYFNVQSVVLGCNTLSVTIREQLQDILNVNVYGVYPPVETALKNGDTTLLIATNNTSKYFERVYKGEKKLCIAPLPHLASEIEYEARHLAQGVKGVNLSPFFNPFLKTFKKHYINIKPPFSKIDTLILGCTHYNFIKNELFDHFKPKIVTSGIPFTVEKFKNSKKKGFYAKKTLKTIHKGEIIFMGKSANFNKKVFHHLFLKAKT